MHVEMLWYQDLLSNATAKDIWQWAYLRHLTSVLNCCNDVATKIF